MKCRFRNCNNEGIRSYVVNGKKIDGMFCECHKPDFGYIDFSQRRGRADARVAHRETMGRRPLDN